MKNHHALILITTALLTGSGCELLDDLPVGRGFTAKYMCSYVFSGGFDETLVKEQYVAPKVSPLPLIWKVNVDHDQQQVVVSDVVFGSKHAATAFYTEGKGCTLLVDKEIESVKSIPFSPMQHAPLDPNEAWPYGAAGLSANTVAGLNYDQLQSAVHQAFDEIYETPVNTTSVVVAYDGQLIAEHYAGGANVDTPLLGWSMTKTLTGMLAGILADQGLLNLDLPAPIERWGNTDKNNITTRHLLNMAGGLLVNEDYGGFSDVTQMLYLESDQYDYALKQPVVYNPGDVFQYSTAEANRLAAVVQSTLGSQQDVYDFYQNELFLKTSITSGFVEFDASGNMVGGAYGFMKARDWARLGQLYLQHGNWNGVQVLSPEWVNFATTPSPAADLYGAQIWLNTQGNRWANVPHDTYYFAGHQGQRILVVPSRKLVVVRTGVTEDTDIQDVLIASLMDGIIAALPDQP